MKKNYSLIFITALTLLVLGKVKADTLDVNVMSNFFDPPGFTVEVGDFIRWTLMESSHTTTSTSVPPGASSWNHTFTGIGDTFVYEVTVAGSYSYECQFHIGMMGTFNAVVPLTGTKDIPGDYPTIEAAIADLNLNGVGSGGVTFNVAAGHTETFTSSTAGVIIATGTSADQIVFQKNGAGANPIVTAGTGTGTRDAILLITGGDYITFDGIDLSENSLNTDNNARMEWGFAILKRNSTAPVDGSWFITLKNSIITLNKLNTDAWGIYSANHTKDTTTSTILTDSLDVMSYCKFSNNTITNSYSGIRIVSSTTAGFQGQNNEVGVDGGNIISNYGGSSDQAYGMNIEYQNNLKVANNTVNNGNGVGHTGTLYGIRTGSAPNGNVDIYNNTVSITQGGSSIMYAITNSTGSSGTDNTVNIYNNIVENCLNPVSTSNSMWLIYNLASAFNLNIYGNIVRNNTKAAGTGTMHCILNDPTSASENNLIYNNQVYGNSSAGPIHGINISEGTNTSVYGNNIYNLTSNSTATTFALGGLTIAGGSSSPVNVYAFNNFISDLKAPFSGSTDGIRGINITGTTGNATRGIYYNTIYLNTSSSGINFGTTGIFHTLSSTATSSVLDMRNNIVVNNSTPNGTGKTVAFRRSSATNLNNYSSLSNNNSFYAGTPGTSNVIFFDGTNFDQTIADFKTRVAPREASSFTENVNFINSTTAPYDLHINTTIGTQTESGATPVTTPISVTTDFDNDTRNATSPDVGADEFNGIAIDITAPFISYTALSHTTSASNRNLPDVTITDGNGINTTAGTAPRIYFKRYSDANSYSDNTSGTDGWKYTETSNTSSPFEFLIDYSFLFGGTGAQGGDTIQYFVVAQDLASTPNVGISVGTFASTPSSVNLTPAAFPVTGSINNYRIQFILNGTVTVGPGGDYSSLTGDHGLFSSINENFVGSNLTIQVTGDLTETGTNSLNEWAETGDGNYTLTIQPDAAVLRNISGSFDGGLIKINGADKVMIDGRFNGTGHFLEFENTFTSSNSATIHVISGGVGLGSTVITIRNSIVKAGSNTSSNIFGIFVGGTTLTTSSSGGADNHNITIEENIVSKCRVGIFARGTSGNPMNNLLIAGNIIGSDLNDEYVTEYGINTQAAVAPRIRNNEVYNLISDVSKWAIACGSNITDAIVSKNRIHSIDQPGTSGFNSVGIYFSSSTGCSGNQIDNNMIYNLNTYGSTSMFLVGIRIVGGTNYKVYYNSVSMTGAFGNTATGIVSSCLYISSATDSIDIRNNILLNTRTGNDPKNYAIHSPNSTTFLSSNYNDFWTTGSVFGFWGADVASFDDWKTATGQDASSLNIDPMFTSNSNLHINSGLTPTPLESGGVVISGITTDFDGDDRPGPAGSINGGATAPDIGADEFDGVPVSSTFSFNIDVTNGWNMVSAPGLHPTNQNVTTWWSGKDPSANVFKYNGGYQSVTTTIPTEGYWMKNLGAQTYNHSGIAVVAHDPIAGNAGWNLIGGYEYNAATAGITTNPAGQQEGSVFGYNGGYQTATELEPGYGYWIKLTTAAQIILPASSFKGVGKVAETINKEWGRIVITDALGRSYTLYSAEGEVNLSMYELPPAPPAGVFDVRYSSGRYAEKIIEKSQQVEMNGLVYPVRVKAEGMNIRIEDETGRIVNERLKDGEEVTISHNINKLQVSADVIPTEFSLEQNYPNPFNPSTVIEFAIPENSKEVRLTIYNALGERVAELVNGSFEPGIYKYHWNAIDMASGLYIYELRTEKFVSVKKMMLMK